ncbi:MAG: TonB-dependent receptor, partial [Oleiphilaceae bacterium]|nr:TonB-dependent receptor [Oleiphilaceae bacterium]
TRGSEGFFPRYIIRGITSTSNPQALLLINGVPATSLVYGNRGNAWGGMPVKSIERIDVIRGPGSALYGADAFSGVINITTKRGKDIKGTITGVRAGSFDTYGAWLEHGGQLGQFELGLTLEYQTSNGQKEIVDSDAQSSWDAHPSTSSNASLAPGEMNRALDMLELRFALDSESTELNVGYQGRYNGETGPGIALALDPNGEFRSDRFNLDIRHSVEALVEHLSTDIRLSYLIQTQEVEEDFYLFPPGTEVPVLGHNFPDGMIGNPGHKEQTSRLDILNTYDEPDRHILKFGLGISHADALEITEEKNFNADFSPKPNKEVVDDIPGEIYLPEKSRTSSYVYFQDEWQIRENWQLTSGIRYDHYSDFGGTWNPRLALIWATTNNLTTKLLYGRAFRAPSMQERLVKNNPILLGNEDLDPETIDTVELGFYNQPSREWRYSVNLFYYEIDDYIEFMPIGGFLRQAQNVGEREGYGGELELTYSTETFNAVANFAHQTSENKRTNSDVGEAPNNQFYMRHEWDLNEKWNLDYQLNWVGKQKRIAGDSREATDDYTTIDITLSKMGFFGQNNEVSFSILNAFNADVREPAPATVPNDLPLAGRSFNAELSLSF